MAFLLSAAAHAGPLAEGFLGAQFGKAHLIRKAPASNCVRPPSDSIRWMCDWSVGSSSMKVYYLVEKHRFVGVMVDGQPADEDVIALRAALTATWGSGQGNSVWDLDASTTWQDGDNYAHWQRDPATGEVQLTVFSASEAIRTGLVTP